MLMVRCSSWSMEPPNASKPETIDSHASSGACSAWELSGTMTSCTNTSIVIRTADGTNYIVGTYLSYRQTVDHPMKLLHPARKPVLTHAAHRLSWRTLREILRAISTWALRFDEKESVGCQCSLRYIRVVSSNPSRMWIIPWCGSIIQS